VTLAGQSKKIPITRRIIGPESTATISLDFRGMQDGDVAGLAIFRHTAGYIGVKKSGGSTNLVMVYSGKFLRNRARALGARSGRMVCRGCITWFRCMTPT
jgi:hypothetical protein